MPVTIKFDPNTSQIQAAVIQDATPRNDGVMTRAQAALLASLAGGGGASAFPFVSWKDGDNWDTTVRPALEAAVTKFGSAQLLLSVSTNAIMDTPTNLDNVQLIGLRADGQPSNVVMQGAFQHTGVGNLWLYNVAVVTKVTICTSPGFSWTLWAKSFIQNDFASNHPCIANGTNAISSITAYDSSSASSVRNGTPCVSMDGGILFLILSSQAASNSRLIAVRGGGAPAQLQVTQDATCQFVDPVVPNITFTNNNTGTAANLFYAPTAGLYVDPQPGSVLDAIERMAALLKTLNGNNPIP